MAEKMLITINRQFGSGGRIIGEELAKALQIELVDQQILEKAAKVMKVKEGFLKKFDETAPTIWSGVNQAYGMFQGMAIPYYQDPITNHELYITETNIIQEIASKKSCVFIGRCANDILKHQPGCIRIYLQAPIAKRMKNATNLYGFKVEKDLKKAIVKKDKQRADYYKVYTQEKWRDTNQYDLVINTEQLGIKGSVQLILDYIKIKHQNKEA